MFIIAATSGVTVRRILARAALSLLMSVFLAAIATAQQPEAPSAPAPSEPPAAPPPHALLPAPPPEAPSSPPPASVPAVQLAPAELTGLLGHAVVGGEGAELGRIVDLLVDNQGQVRAVVVDVGGFMGVGSRKVAVAWSALRFAAGEKGPVISILIPPDRIKSWADYIVGRPVSILGTPGSGL
jgi:sporulation protein YlmC with PRC-barrel domain